MNHEPTTETLAAQTDAALAKMEARPQTPDTALIVAALRAYRSAFRDLLSYDKARRA